MSADAVPVISTLEEASSLLERLRALASSISEAASSPTLKTEQDYISGVVPQLDEATTTYQALATFLREHKRGKAESGGFRDVQRSFVRVMQELQTAQRQAAARREALCDADFMAGNGSVAISAQEIQTAKEEVLEAGEIAQEAAAVNALFRQVGTLVSEQGQGWTRSPPRWRPCAWRSARVWTSCSMRVSCNVRRGRSTSGISACSRWYSPPLSSRSSSRSSRQVGKLK